jgi:hypothetical protein
VQPLAHTVSVAAVAIELATRTHNAQQSRDP